MIKNLKIWKTLLAYLYILNLFFALSMLFKQFGRNSILMDFERLLTKFQLLHIFDFCCYF